MRHTLPLMDERKERTLRKEIGRRLQQARLSRKLTLEALSAEINDAIGAAAINHYEKGRRRPGPLEATVLARALHVSPAYILCVDDAGESDMLLAEEELRLIISFRRLPLEDRKSYLERIEGLAKLYGEPVPDEVLPPVFREHPIPRPSKPKSGR